MLKRLKKDQKKKGFTLIELVIVLAVLAIIALIAIPNFAKVREDSQEKADKSTGDVITRITNMAIANEDIIITTKSTKIKINIKPEENVEIQDKHVTVAPGDERKFDFLGKENYVDALKEVKKPQTKNATGYIVEITNDANGIEKVETIVDVPEN